MTIPGDSGSGPIKGGDSETDSDEGASHQQDGRSLQGEWNRDNSPWMLINVTQKYEIRIFIPTRKAKDLQLPSPMFFLNKSEMMPLYCH